MRQTLDGGTLAGMIIHGAASINLEKQRINELNVFPVPDGDTGTNMSLTIGAAAAELKKKPPKTVGEVAAVNAAALLRGARGNSGVILSLLFRGFAKSLKDMETMDGADFALALDAGVATAYNAVMKPAEGPLLTVSRCCAKRAAEASGDNPAMEYVLEETIREGRLALAETVNQNPVLNKAGVVDAGGAGFLIILQGMLDDLRGVPMPAGESEASPAVREKADFGTFATEDIKFGYCTEFICSRDGKRDPEALRGFLSALGDSLVLVDDDEIIKVHVHTNHPGRALEEALTYGNLLTVKVENMREQHTEILESAGCADETQRKIAPPEKDVGFVAVCAGEGLAAVFRDLGVDGIISGGQTMNPSTEDILREIDRIPAKLVYIFPNNKNIIMAAQQALPLVEGKTAAVIPTASIPEGISALLAFDPDGTEEANTEAMTRAAEKIHTAEITYAARDSDFDGAAIRQGDYLALCDNQLFGTGREIEALLRDLAGADVLQKAEFLTVFYGRDVSAEDAQRALAVFTELCPKAEITLLDGGQPIYYYLISAE
jgi:DAK2 domain fusion protein YloV